MLKSPLIHPDILFTIARNGHGAMILIADGNFPAGVKTSATSTKVFLNLAPGVCKTTEVLKTLMATIPVEKAIAMIPGSGLKSDLHTEYVQLLGKTPMTTVDKKIFYEHVGSEQNCLTIVTGDMRRFANIILVMGVHSHEDLYENAEVELLDTIVN
jgi:L-fucose mutarotase